MPDETDAPRDVLAAEEFAVPAPDPRLSEQEARDVLAAEEFGVPAPDPRLRITSQPIILPPDPKDPQGANPARDVLAAEEFAVPGGAPEVTGSDSVARRSRTLTALAAVAAGVLLMRGRQRRRRG